MCQHLRLRPIVLVHTQVYHKKCSVKELKKKRGRKEKKMTFSGHSDSHRKAVKQNHTTLTCWTVPQFVAPF